MVRWCVDTVWVWRGVGGVTGGLSGEMEGGGWGGGSDVLMAVSMG